MEVVVGSKLQELLCPIPRVGSSTLCTDRQSVVFKLVPVEVLIIRTGSMKNWRVVEKYYVHFREKM